MPPLPAPLPHILKTSFVIRFTMTRRKSGGLRTVETTYYWNGDNEVVLSGYPGRRDWVANMAADPTVTLHTVEFEPWFDIPGRARVLWKTNERLPHLFNFIDRWAERPGFPRRRFAFALGAIKLNRKLASSLVGPLLARPQGPRQHALRRRHLHRPPCPSPLWPPTPLRTPTPLTFPSYPLYPSLSLPVSVPPDPSDPTRVNTAVRGYSPVSSVEQAVSSLPSSAK